VLTRRRRVEEVANVVAGAEDGFVALNHHHAHGRIVDGLLQRVGHGPVHRGRDRIFLVHPVQGDGHHTGIGVGQDVLGGVAHCSASFTKSSRS
jgi:hypothetical protein